ncbi:hypothetical protein ACH4U6_16480 [Streptomyces netropsis]|uniref:hypothetical protein n=1 Tax=Streptomyces netropsis TaxID=55404 RepID=UPI0037B694AA
MQRHRIETTPWAALDAVQFTRNRGVLVLRVRAGAPLPGTGRVLNRPMPLPYYALGNTLRPWRRREHYNLIVAAVQRFAPGTYTDEPWRYRKVRHNPAAAARRTP